MLYLKTCFLIFLLLGQGAFAVENNSSCEQGLNFYPLEGDTFFSREVKNLVFNKDFRNLKSFLHSYPDNTKLSPNQKKHKAKGLIRLAESDPDLNNDQKKSFYLQGLELINELGILADPGLLYLKARAQMAIGENLKAIETVERMIQLKIADSRAFMIKAKALSSLNRSGESLVVIDQQLVQEPNSLFLMTYKAQILFAQNRLHEAAGVLQRALHLYPNDFVALAIQAKVYLRLGAYQKAIDIAERLMSDDNRSIKTRQVAGTILLHAKLALGQTDLSLQMVDELISLTPESMTLLSIKFRLLLRQGSLEKAENLAQLIYTKFADHILAKKYLIKIWLLNGKIEQATQFLDKNNLWLNENMIHTVVEYFLLTKQPYQAERFLFEKASMQDRGSRISYWRLASYYHNTGDNVRAIQVLKRFLNQSPHVDLKIMAAFLNIGGQEAKILKPVLMKSLNISQQNFVNKVAKDLNWLDMHSQVSNEEWQLEYEDTPISMKNLVWTGQYDQPIDTQAVNLFRRQSN